MAGRFPKQVTPSAPSQAAGGPLFCSVPQEIAVVKEGVKEKEFMAPVSEILKLNEKAHMP